MSDLNAPIDNTHAMCLQARDEIRYMIAPLIAAARQWQPAPIPDRQEFP